MVKKKKKEIPVITIEIINLRELEPALLETKKDIKQKKFVKESVEKHIKRIKAGTRHC